MSSEVEALKLLIIEHNDGIIFWSPNQYKKNSPLQKSIGKKHINQP